MKAWPERLGAIGAVVAAAACPICFPKLALVGALFGLGAFAAYEYHLFIATQALVAVAMLGHVLAYARARNARRLVAALASGATVFAGLYLLGSEWVVYIGFGGLVAVSVMELRSRRVSAAMQTDRSLITCPECGFKRVETMPQDSCLFFYDCTSCGARLRPKSGNCCVFCSYGSVRCPSKQLEIQETS
jgi:hypothetical protein